MKAFKKIVNEMRDTVELKKVVEVYEQVAATKMQRIRQDILVSREFYDGLMKVSQDVGLDLGSLVMIKPRPEAVVFVSANAGLYGDIIQRTFGLFLDYVQKNRADVFVIGKVGTEMMHRGAPQINFQSIEISDEQIEEDKFMSLSETLMGYEKITVFYGRFGSIINQYGHSSTISGEILKELQSKTGKKDKFESRRLKYLYEPDVPTISEFFGNEIMTAVFEAMLRESQLAKFGSRLMHLDMAIDKIDDQFLLQSVEKTKIRKRILEQKQRQTLSKILFK